MNSKFGIIVLSLIAGALYPFGFAPFEWWPLSVLSVAMAFTIWSNVDAQMARWSALFYGLGSFGIGVSWVYVSMVTFGSMAPIMASIAVLLFALILTSFTYATAWLGSVFMQYVGKTYAQILIFPALWVLFEYLRGTILTGFPWLQLGYASVGTWYSGWATLSGVLASSYCWAFIAGILAWFFTQRNKRVGTYVVFSIAIITLVSWGLSLKQWTNPTGESLDVSLIQADISLSEKWRPENRDNIIQTYLAASKAIEQTDLIVWPEGALPVIFDNIPAYFLEQIKNLNTPVAFGVSKLDNNHGQAEFYNALTVLSEDQTQIYRKVHLVPFGEFFPFQTMLGWLFETLSIPMSNFSTGQESQGNLVVNGVKLLPTICYEDAFPEDWRHKVSDSNIILNISEDAWFGDSFAPHQRLQMAKMRALEFQRPVIRASNSGLSTIINADGTTDAVSPQFQPALFNSPVFPMQGETPYMMFGQWPLWIWLILSSAYAILRQLSPIRK